MNERELMSSRSELQESSEPRTSCDAPASVGDVNGAAADRLNAQDAARCRRVEDAIYKRARGYKIAVRKTYKVKRVEYDPDTGKKVSEREELETGLDEVVVPADVRAGAYWLVNRAPERWQEHPQPETGEALGGEVNLPPLTEVDEEVVPVDGTGDMPVEHEI